jgi:hypothetical protein
VWNSVLSRGVRVWGMRPGIIIDVTAADRDRLEAIVADRNSPQKHVWRAAIVVTATGSARTRSCAGPARARQRSGTGRTALPAPSPMDLQFWPVTCS